MRLAILGIGNELNGDDAAGVLAARALRPAGNHDLLVIEAGPAPENFTGTLRRFQPDVVLLVDAAELGEPPGSVAWVSWTAAGGWSGSTHTLPPTVLARFLVEELGCQVILVGIQPARLDFDAGLSEPVQNAIGAVVEEIKKFSGPVRHKAADKMDRLKKEDILDGLLALGVQPGMGLVVHASLKSFGYVEGGALAVIEALMEALTEEGTLIMPSFNHRAPFEEGGPGVYDPLRTPTSNGAIPDRFWRLPGVLRSLDPTHPCAAWGRHARRYVEFHHRTLTMGPRSPLGLLHADGGSGLLLGVGYHANTFHHVVEMTTGAPCLGRRTEAYPVVLPDGRRVTGRTWGWRERGCPLTDAVRYAADMETRGLQRQVAIGSCRATLFRLSDCFAVVAELLQRGRDGYPPCSACPIRPGRVPETTVSDWDDENESLLPGSEAWEY
jgi:hydrogenase maturation protease HycI